MVRERKVGRGRGPRTGALASPDWVVLRSYWLRAVLGLGGGGKARGVSGLNGESPTLRGLLGTHVQAPGRSARGVAVRPLPGRRAPPPSARPPGRCSPAGGRGRSQAGSSCPSPGRGRTLRSGRSRAGVCGASRPGRRGGGLHCDPGRGALTSQNPFLQLGNPRAARALSAAVRRELEGCGHGSRRPPAARWGRPRNRAWHPGPSADTGSNLYRRGYDSLPGAGAGHGGHLTRAGFCGGGGGEGRWGIAHFGPGSHSIYITIGPEF